MIIYRIVKANSDQRPYKGDVLQFKTIDMDKLPDGRKMAEKNLEEYRKCCVPKLNGRLDSIFVFPDNKIEDRASHWAFKFVSRPGDLCQCYLLEMEVDEPVIWHDATFFEDLCLLYKGDKSFMTNRMSDHDLIENYWLSQEKLDNLSIEGMVKRGEIVSVSSCEVSRTSFKILEKDI